MAAFGVGTNRTLPGRGPSPGFRFTLYATLAIVMMFLDQRGDWLGKVRYVLQAAAYPLQLAVNSPSAAWRWASDSIETRDSLRAENTRLRARERELLLRALRFEALQRENAQLRALRSALPPVAERWLAAEVVSVELSNLRQRLLINRGTQNGVFRAQAVLDDRGLLGQTIRIGPWSAEILLITDPEHAVPVQIERNGLRTIAVGAGDAKLLALPYLPANADVRSGDLLVTSGLGGVFPQGYPVARIVEVRRDAAQPLAQVRAEPLAGLDSDREVMLVWFREQHPAAPADATSGELSSGDPRFQPQRTPPKPAAARPAPTPAPAAASPTPSAAVSGAAPAGGGAASPAPAAASAAPPDPSAETPPNQPTQEQE